MADLLEFSAASELIGWLAMTAAKGLAILLVVTLVCLALRNAAASLKHLCWGLGLGAILVLPLLTLVVPSWNVGLLEAPQAGSLGSAPADESAYAISAQPSAPAVPQHPEAPVPAETQKSATKAPTAAQHSATEARAAARQSATEARAAAQQSATEARAAAQKSAANAPAGAQATRAKVAAEAQQPGAGAPAAVSQRSAKGSSVVHVAAARLSAAAQHPAAVWIIAVWAAGTVVLLLHLIVGSIQVRRIVRSANAVTNRAWLDPLEEIGDRLFVPRNVRLLETSRVTVPVASGAIQPVILIPRGTETWSDERRRCVLAHELAHVKRWDTVTQAAALVARAVHWFNPLAWKAVGAMQLEREKACDDYVLQASRTRASEYAGHLLDIARRTPGALTPPAGAIAMARRSQLEGRVLSILDDDRRRSLEARPLAAAVVAAVLLVFPIAAMSPYGAPPSAEPDLTEIGSHPAEPAAGSVSAVEPRTDARYNAPSPSASEARDRAPATWSLDTIERTFAVADGGRLILDADHGNVHVESGSSGEVHVVVRRTPRGSVAADEYEVEFEQKGNDVHVVGNSRIRHSGRNGISVDFMVTVPHRFNVDARTAGGNMAVDDLNGRAKLNTSGGNLSLGRITGEVDARTSGGNISVDGSDGSVVVNTSGGNIDLGRVGGTVRATTSGGNISVDEVNGEIIAKTSGGQIMARIAHQPKANSLLRTSGGGISVYLAEGIAIDLDAETSAGRVRSDVEIAIDGPIKKDEVRGRINGGGPLLELETSAGDIRIERL